MISQNYEKVVERISRETGLEIEESDRTNKGQRVFKDELALAVHYLVMTTGMPQKEVAELLGISNSDVSKFKNKGTKLRQKK